MYVTLLDMLLVKNYVYKSPVHGCGLFADEDIPAGRPIWAFDPKCDWVISPERFFNLALETQKYVQHFGYLNPLINCFIVSRDGARFINHSDEPKVITMPTNWSSEGIDIAAVDIARGEELTMDYRRFDADFSRKLSSVGSGEYEGRSSIVF
jgi:hypothetical protein